MEKQFTLKPHDFVLAIYLLLERDTPRNYKELSQELLISVSEVHAGLKRAHLARLVTASRAKSAEPVPQAIREFTLFGAKYAFPAVLGAETRGLPTAHFASPLKEELVSGDQQGVVWPYAEGNSRGMALYPLYPRLPKAAWLKPHLYEVLTLFDALRMGAARERELASRLLSERLQ